MRALLSEGDAVDRLYRRSIAHLGRTRVRVELARAHLLYGEWLRRQRRRLDAREQLRTAHDLLDAMGVEAMIARLARDGLSNPEIGTRLFISTRTVQYHLGKVFAKLAISSRSQLHRVLPGDRTPPGRCSSSSADQSARCGPRLASRAGHLADANAGRRQRHLLGRMHRVDTADCDGCPGRKREVVAPRPSRTEVVMSSAAETAIDIRPFQVEIPDGALDELRRRLAGVRWPSEELVADRSQGVQLATLQALVRYWASDYDLSRVQARLNALPQFLTEIDGVEVHFLQVKSPHAGALALVMTHGWPGSVVELLETIGPLTDPTAHGGHASDAFDLVLPSLPGYGFSGEPAELGWDPARIARAWAALMDRLGYTRFVAQGGDVGASVTDAMGRQAPPGLAGIHLNLLVTVPAGPQPTESEQEHAAAEELASFRTTGFGYFLEQATRPQTIGYGLVDSPVALAAWMLDHDTDSYHKIRRAFLDDEPTGGLTRDHILDNITLYWLTGTGASAARSYWESGRAATLAAGQPPVPVQVPVGFTTFPDEIFQAPHSWVERGYPTLSYYHQADQGGHFAAWEQPQLFTTELRAAFNSLR